ncbi:helix-turn-helix domain-containing protein [Halovivax sp.]|uniref:helix-turn-helix domain-containing protein n=1 Tax=Halovivax sp. TaxID=1935978 RepID=UPI0025B83DE6|nr:helix-turn-helix domain-containing protein [Halovivax sp.]
MSDLEEADRLRVSFTVTDVESVRTVLEELTEADATVEPRGMSIVDPNGDARVEIDVGEITPKQWEALELAHERGYYERPRRTNLDELAAELGVSKSAVSQRLCAAEARLVGAVLENATSR